MAVGGTTRQRSKEGVRESSQEKMTESKGLSM